MCNLVDSIVSIKGGKDTSHRRMSVYLEQKINTIFNKQVTQNSQFYEL